MKDYKFAIIGGAGFLGSRLKERFDKEGQEYLIYDINTSAHKDKTVYLDVEDKNLLNQLKGCEYIINLAAEHRDDIKNAMEWVSYGIRRSMARSMFPQFPEGCQGKLFREVYQLNKKVSLRM